MSSGYNIFSIHESCSKSLLTLPLIQGVNPRLLISSDFKTLYTSSYIETYIENKWQNNGNHIGQTMENIYRDMLLKASYEIFNVKRSTNNNGNGLLVERCLFK